MAGIENIKKTLGLAIDTAKEIANLSSADSSWSKIQVVMGLSDNVMAVAGIDIAAVKAEYADLDAVEMAALKAYMAAKFDIADDKLEAKIEATFNWLLDVAKILEGGLGLSKLYV